MCGVRLSTRRVQEETMSVDKGAFVTIQTQISLSRHAFTGFMQVYTAWYGNENNAQKN